MGVKEGYKKTEVGVIPEDWDVKQLVKLCVPQGIVRGPFGGSLKKEIFKSSGFKIYEQRNAIYKSVEIGSYFIDRNKYAEMQRFSISPGDFIISCSGTIGRIYQMPPDAPLGIINQALLKLTVDGKCVNDHFFYHYFEWDDFQARIIDSTQGGAMKNLVGMDIFKATPIVSPPLVEQKTIAKALSDMDGLIEALDKLISKKRAIKQATMQQLLTGKTRLPGFDGEWEAVPLGKLAAIRNQKIMPAKVNDSFMCVELEHIGQGTGQLLKLSTASESASSKYRFFEGDVLFGRLRSYLRKYWYADQDGLCSTEIWPLITIPEELFSGYLHYLVQTEQFIEIASISYGTHMPRADWHVISNFKINLPRSITEQKAIATVLSDMDTEITALTQRRNKTKMIKQGMMQELLTGRTRLVTPKKEKKA